MTVDELKNLLSRFHIKPSHKMGQNFLLSEKALDEIVNAAALKSDDTVLEIGPGLGVLTRRLGESAGLVLAVEKDYKLVNALRKLFKGKKNIKVTQGDALFLDSSVILSGAKDLDSSPPKADQNDKLFKYKLIANIPYYITGKLLQNFLTSPAKPTLMVLLLQKEVAERITARPGDMSVLAVSVQFYADPEIISPVPRAEFYPAPEVDSAIIKIKMLARPRFDVDEQAFFRLVKIGFSNKRKQLHNNLASGLGNPSTALRSAQGVKNVLPELVEGRDYKKILESIGLNPLCRAQELSMEHWEKLYRSLKSQTPVPTGRQAMSNDQPSPNV